jgi:hypothetical protein
MVSLKSINIPDFATTSEINALGAVPNGSIIYNVTIGALVFTSDSGTTWRSVASISDIPTPSYGQIDFQGNTTVTALTQNVNATPVVPAVGGYTEGPTSSDFELGAFSGAPGVINALKYTGTNTRTFKVTASISVTNVSGSPDMGIFYIGKNATILLDSAQSQDIDVTPSNIKMQHIEPLSTGDVFQVVMKNTQNNDDWICVDLNLIAIALD